MSQTVLIFGKSGQVATELARATWPFAAHLEMAGRDRCDLSTAKRDDIHGLISDIAPALVVNAAAYTAVDKAEDETEAANHLNAQVPGWMAEACASLQIPLIHISTDYVFDGSKTSPYLESDPIQPVSAYGQSKADGEAAVREALDAHVILRTAWVYSAHGGNFVKTMLRLGGERDELNVVHDQRGCPTSAEEIAAAIAQIGGQLLGKTPHHGTYHYCGDTVMTWYEFSKAIFEESRKRGAKTPKYVWPIPTSEYPTPAKRPANSVLDISKIRADFGVCPPPMRQMLRACLDELLAPQNP